MRHVIRSQDFTKAELESLFKEATRLETSPQEDALRGHIMASLFYEPSTRTRFSFEAAMLRLGGSVLTTENAKEFSSAAKGETLEDSIRVINNYADVIVLRHYEVGASARAADVSRVPIINAGDGPGQHPTQGLLDLYTIWREVGRLENLTVALVGDLKHGRTVRSLAYLLGKYRGNHIVLVSPKGLRIDTDIKEYLERHTTGFEETESLERAIDCADVLYQTRVQKERFPDSRTYNKYRGAYVLTSEHARSMKPDSIIMHPLPRVDEIATEVDASSKAVYFKQARYGLLVRMALLRSVLKR